MKGKSPQETKKASWKISYLVLLLEHKQAQVTLSDRDLGTENRVEDWVWMK